MTQEQARLDWFFHAATEGILVIGDGVILDCNPAYAEMIGLPIEAIVGSEATRFTPPERLAIVTERLAWGDVGPLQDEILRPDGTRLVCQFTSRHLQYRGQQVRVVTIRRQLECCQAEIRPSTSLAQVDEALLASETRLKAIVNHSPLGLVALDATGRIIRANPAATRIFGHQREALIGLHVEALLDDANPGAWQRLREQGMGQTVTCRARRRTGESFSAEATLFQVHVAGDLRYGIHWTDLTERQALDRMKKDFVSVVSHELRTPLTSLRGALSLLSGGGLGSLPESAAKMIALADRNVVRLVNLVNDILDLERLHAGEMHLHPREIVLADVVRQSIEAVAGTPRADWVRLAPIPADAKVWGDCQRLIQVVINLLSNAFKFSPPDTPIHVRWHHDAFGEGIAVSNEGAGIPPDMQGAIFERFRQAETSEHTRAAGSGLGLAICKGIIDQHGGRIGVESTPGRGATFWFTIPRQEFHGGPTRQAH